MSWSTRIWRPCLTKEVQNEGGYSTPPESGLAVCETAPVYCPRNPEESILYGVVAAQLETFLERQHRRDRPVPRFVERELRSFLECGVLAHGFLRVPAMPAARIGSSHFRARVVRFAHHAAAARWPTPRRIW